MGMKIPDTDNTGLNMTPMIDIVFQLVTFFMLTLDMSKKELAALDLPRAHQGIEDKDPATQDPHAKKADTTRFTINLKPDGNIMFKGKDYPLAVPDPVAQYKSLEALKTELVNLTRDKSLRDETGASKVMILVRGDRTTKWKYVQWIMQVCADEKIQIYKIHFGVEHPPAKPK
jgi:biopolymer transport protein ExbD